MTERVEAEQKHLFINSIPKSGTVLLTNIVCKFLTNHEYHYSEWLTLDTMSSQIFECSKPKLFVGHLVLTPSSYKLARRYRQLLLIRNPVDQLCSYARFLCSQEMSDRAAISNYIHANNVPPSVVLRFLTEGLSGEADAWLPYEYEYRKILAWSSCADIVVKYENLSNAIRLLKGDAESAEPAHEFFDSLLGSLHLSCAGRYGLILEASDTRASQTHRSNLSALVDMKGFPSEEDVLYLETRLHDLRNAFQSVNCFSEKVGIFQPNTKSPTSASYKTLGCP